MAQGYLFPSFHTFYWLGLNASSWPVDSGTPNFTWLDKTPGPSNESYLHWGLWVMWPAGAAAAVAAPADACKCWCWVL